MKRYELGSLLFKCLGIFLILLAIENGASVLFNLVLSFGQHLDWQMASSLAMGLFFLGTGLLAIRWSDSLGRKIYPHLPDEPTAGHLTAIELASIVFAGIGVVFIVLAVAWIARYLVILTIFLANSSPGETGYRSQLIGYLGILFRYLCQGFLGAGLFLRAQTLAEWWSRLRGFQDFAEESSDDEEGDEIDSGGRENRPRHS